MFAWKTGKLVSTAQFTQKDINVTLHMGGKEKLHMNRNACVSHNVSEHQTQSIKQQVLEMLCQILLVRLNGRLDSNRKTSYNAN